MKNKTLRFVTAIFIQALITAIGISVLHNPLVSVAAGMCSYWIALYFLGHFKKSES